MTIKKVIKRRRIESITERRKTIHLIDQALIRLEWVARHSVKLTNIEEEMAYELMKTMFDEVFGKARDLASKIDKWGEL